MDNQGSMPPAGRPTWAWLLKWLLRLAPLILFLGLGTAVVVTYGQLQMVLIVVSIATSLPYMLFWTLRVLISRRARIAFKSGGRILWEGLVPLALIWISWAFLYINPQLQTTILGLAVLAAILFCIGAYAVYVTEANIEDEMGLVGGCGEGCLEVLLGGFLG